MHVLHAHHPVEPTSLLCPPPRNRIPWAGPPNTAPGAVCSKTQEPATTHAPSPRLPHARRSSQTRGTTVASKIVVAAEQQTQVSREWQEQPAPITMLVARNHVHSKAPVIGEALQAAIANVRSDTAREDWVLCGFDGGEDIRLIGTGVGGVEALKASIVKWDVCYGLVRCSHTLEQAGYVQTDFVKFVWVYWRPDNIPVMRKMKIGVNEGEMKSMFAPYHAELQACALHELGEQPLADVLDSVTMRADRTTTRKLERSPSSPSLLARGRAAWKLARSSLPSMHFAHLAIADEQKKVAASTNVEFEEPEAFARAVKDVRSDMSIADWCLLGYKNETVLRMVGTGKGGLQCLLDAAEPYGVNYGLLQVSEKFDGVFHEAYCFISWIPENIPAFVKARVSTHQGAIATAFRKHVHCQFYFRASERSDVTMDVIRNRVRQIIGKGDRPPRRPSIASTEASTSPSSGPSPTATPPPPAAVDAAKAAPTLTPDTAVTAVSVGGGGGGGGSGANDDGDSSGTDDNLLVSPASDGADAGDSAMRPVYVAAKTRTNSLRNSIVIKADALKKAKSPSEEEKSNFPRMFLNSLTSKGSGDDKNIGTSGSGGSGSSSGSSHFGSTGGAKTSGEGEAKTMGVVGEPKSRDSPQQQRTTQAATAPAVLTSVQEALRRVRNGGDGADFVVVEWRQGVTTTTGVPQQEQLEIKECGVGGVQAMADCLEQNSVMYGLARVTETFQGKDSAGGSGSRDKFCCVKRAPDDGPADQRTPELQGEVSRLFHPYHGDLTAKHAGDVTTEAVSSRVSRRLKQ